MSLRVALDATPETSPANSTRARTPCSLPSSRVSSRLGDELHRLPAVRRLSSSRSEYSCLFEAWPVKGDESLDASSASHSYVSQPEQQGYAEIAPEPENEEPDWEHFRTQSKRDADRIFEYTQSVGEQLTKYKNPERRHRRLMSRLGADGYLYSSHAELEAYAVYLYHHRDDIPNDPEYVLKHDQADRALWIYSYGRGFEIAPRQQELFGGWTWPKGDAAADNNVKIGPKNEEVCASAPVPAGFESWEELRKARKTTKLKLSKLIKSTTGEEEAKPKEPLLRLSFSRSRVRVEAAGRRFSFRRYSRQRGGVDVARDGGAKWSARVQGPRIRLSKLRRSPRGSR